MRKNSNLSGYPGYNLTISAEPKRSASYSNDLRWRIVWQKIAMDLPFRVIARNLSISMGTAYNIQKLFCQTGEVSPKKLRKREECRKLDNYHENYIMCMISSDPTLYLSDFTQQIYDITGVAVSYATVCRLLAKHGFTRKRVKQIALQRNCNYSYG